MFDRIANGVDPQQADAIRFYNAGDFIENYNWIKGMVENVHADADIERMIAKRKILTDTAKVWYSLVMSHIEST
jgi:hypothetical protein